MSRITVTGIDPGLVHTGVVWLDIYPVVRTISVGHHVIEGGDTTHAHQAKQLLTAQGIDGPVFVESYRERGTSYSTNTDMRELLAAFRKQLPKATILDNTGVKRVVRKPLMRALGLDQFPTTHHQDLQSAARILLYGMLKDEELNALVYRIVNDHVLNDPWKVER